jgi:hypothetical protein
MPPSHLEFGGKICRRSGDGNSIKQARQDEHDDA